MVHDGTNISRLAIIACVQQLFIISGSSHAIVATPFNRQQLRVLMYRSDDALFVSWSNIAVNIFSPTYVTMFQPTPMIG